MSELLKCNLRIILAEQRFRSLPNLDKIILGGAAHQPRIIKVEAEVGDAVGMATMHEESTWLSARCSQKPCSARKDLQFWRPVLRVFWRLLIATFVEVPEAHSAIVAATCQDGLLTWVPFDLTHNISVSFTEMQWHFQVSQVPYAHRLVRTTRRKQPLDSGIPGHGVYGVFVRICCFEGRAVGGWRAGVDDLQGEIV